MNTKVSVRKTERNGRDWFEVSCADQDARDRFGATCGRASTLTAALADFSRRTIKVMDGAPEVNASDLEIV